MTLKELSEKLWKFEQDNNLFSIKIGGYHIWNILRGPLFIQSLSKNIYNGNTAHPNIKKTKLEDLFQRFKRMKTVYKRTCLKGNFKADYLVFDVDKRDINIHNYAICEYIHPLILQFDKEKKSYQLIEKYPYSNNPTSYVRETIKPLYWIKSFIKIYFIMAKYKNTIAQLSSNLDSFFNENKNNTATIKKKLFYFIYEELIYSELLRKRKTKEVYCASAYGSLLPLISACKNNNIKITEIQHGVIDKYHYGYSFPEQKNIPYFPNVLRLWGKYWHESCENYLPIKSDKIEYIENSNLKREANKHKLSKKKNIITFISQGPIANQLYQTACNLSKLMPDFEIVYRLHPSELLNSPLYSESEKSKNMRLDLKHPSLYESFAESKYVVGVSSTAIFEAIYFDCSLICFNAPSVEYMEFIISKGVPLANTAEDIKTIITKNKMTTLDKEYFFG